MNLLSNLAAPLFGVALVLGHEVLAVGGSVADEDSVTIWITYYQGQETRSEPMHELRVNKRIQENLAALVDRARESHGFIPFVDSTEAVRPTIAWVDRAGPPFQHITIDFKNRRILAQTFVGSNKCKLERYDWDSFEYEPGDWLRVPPRMMYSSAAPLLPPDTDHWKQ